MAHEPNIKFPPNLVTSLWSVSFLLHSLLCIWNDNKKSSILFSIKQILETRWTPDSTLFSTLQLSEALNNLSNIELGSLLYETIYMRLLLAPGAHASLMNFSRDDASGDGDDDADF
ncbi:hypothetical protein POM88_027690 [Heracleum sosnowskyi]|uniref:Uncharacterized protein n=1 Tax=Heracleum sosnowskyi TaxID=360622 RepID=A0AAD8I8F3_9APIA|nr:hypothetical protein POM88_027690 [Heracleum sosnowskyi]